MILVAKNIYKKYGDLEVLKGVDLEIQKAEVVSIVGASGAGKSTLLHILGALDQPDSGEVIYENTKIDFKNQNKLANFRNQKIGFVFQFHHLLPEFTALENIMIPALISGTAESKAKTKALDLLQLLKLKDRAQHKPSQLSGGEQQRVAISRALVTTPEILFADEPTGNLDQQNAARIQDIFFQLKELFNLTLVVVTHDSGFASRFPRVMRMVDGRWSDKH